MHGPAETTYPICETVRPLFPHTALTEPASAGRRRRARPTAKERLLLPNAVHQGIRVSDPVGRIRRWYRWQALVVGMPADVTTDVVPGANHWVLEENPAYVLNSARTFLTH